ncbi:chaplin [Streptomyces sp. NRRL S-350]|uniref:chaplin n=1 Tax=Streptomyces sp. NRRL S-350 TaxID=1463902 RepID=UPI0004C2AFF8|nr:chaplin [Streptomyces sp. NRRL S-350]
MRIRTYLAASAVAAVCVLAGAGTAAADANANGVAFGSPGVLSGNQIQIPIHIPINICGNSVDLVGIANPAFGNICINA